MRQPSDHVHIIKEEDTMPVVVLLSAREVPSSAVREGYALTLISGARTAVRVELRRSFGYTIVVLEYLSGRSYTVTFSQQGCNGDRAYCPDGWRKEGV